MNDIFSKLNTLKSIKPDENWVVDAKKRVLLNAPVSEKKSVLERLKMAIFGIQIESDIPECRFQFEFRKYFQNFSFQKMAVPAFSLVFVLSTSVFTVGASKSSLPGEFLYSLKMMNEDVILAVTPENRKATIEMEQAGKRLEEMAEISKKTSDVGQQEKMEQLIEKFEKKVNNANNRLSKTSGNGEKARMAKAINTQSKKYTEILAKTTEELPTIVQDEILENVEKAVASSEKIYLTSLTAMIEEMTDENKDEITAMVKEKVEEKEDDEEDIVEDEENIEDDQDVVEEDVDEAEENTEEIVETAETKEDVENIEDIKKELLEDLEDLNNPEEDGEVLGAEDCVCEVEDNECGCEEEVVGEEELDEEEINENL